jgi:hypothetical protein
LEIAISKLKSKQLRVDQLVILREGRHNGRS